MKKRIHLTMKINGEKIKRYEISMSNFGKEAYKRFVQFIKNKNFDNLLVSEEGTYLIGITHIFVNQAVRQGEIGTVFSDAVKSAGSKDKIKKINELQVIFNALTKELENETLTDNLIGVNDCFSEMYLSRKLPELGIISYEVA